LEQIVTWIGEQRRLQAALVKSASAAPLPARKERRGLLLSALWNRGLPARVRISQRVIWPLWLLPIALLNQLVAPHPVWVVLVVALLFIYSIALIWVRSQATAVDIKRERVGAVLLAGDTLREEFRLTNNSPFPVLWAECIDHSTFPGYTAGRVVGCGAGSQYRWHTSYICRSRGIFQLGPHDLRLADPLGLFQVSIHDDESDIVLIYPSVAHLPVVTLPHGDASGAARRRRPLPGPLTSASVRDYRATDSLRYIHWPLTAHRGALMVKELEIEPSGGVWIILDLNRAAHRTVDEVSTLEFSVTVAASLAGELLLGGERRVVGLLTVSDHPPVLPGLVPTDEGVRALAAPMPVLSRNGADLNERAVVEPPQAGQSQLWRILAALAPVQATELSLAELLQTSRRVLGRRGTVVLVTPHTNLVPGETPWTAELLNLEAAGLASSVVLITAPDEPVEVATPLRTLLTRYDIPVQTLQAGTRLQAALAFRRTRKVVRNTPTGGVVTYEVEEEVG
jgi:uncharacterized protein (DUF58 family)